MRRITLLLLLATTATCYGQSNTDIPADQAPSGSSYIDEDRPQIEQSNEESEPIEQSNEETRSVKKEAKNLDELNKAEKKLNEPNEATKKPRESNKIMKKPNDSNRTTQRLNTLIVSDRMRKSKLCDVNSNQKVHLAHPFNIISADNTSRPNAPPFLVQDM